MKVSMISIHCEDSKHNQHPRARVERLSGDTLTLDIATDDSRNQITFFLSEEQVINFKNSVISAVDNYKRGNK